MKSNTTNIPIPSSQTDTRGISQGICESELNANWHRHFGPDSYVNHIQSEYIQAQKTIFDDLIFKSFSNR